MLRLVFRDPAKRKTRLKNKKGYVVSSVMATVKFASVIVSSSIPHKNVLPEFDVQVSNKHFCTSESLATNSVCPLYRFLCRVFLRPSHLEQAPRLCARPNFYVFSSSYSLFALVLQFPDRKTILGPVFNFLKKKTDFAIFSTNFNFGGSNSILDSPDGLIWTRPVFSVFSIFICLFYQFEKIIRLYDFF